MAREVDVKQWRDELVSACRLGEEARARDLVRQPGPQKARALLESMLDEDEGLVRQAAVFGLAELGGAASARRLEQQLVREEARGDRDGELRRRGHHPGAGRARGNRRAGEPGPQA